MSPSFNTVDIPLEESHDVLVRERLETLGVSLLSEWDALVFVYCHGASLTRAAQIAQLLGDYRSAVSAALDQLESLGLIECSRGSQGISLYRFSIPTDCSRYSCFLELMRLAEERTGRRLLLKHLPARSPRPSIRTDKLPSSLKGRSR